MIENKENYNRNYNQYYLGIIFQTLSIFIDNGSVLWYLQGKKYTHFMDILVKLFIHPYKLPLYLEFLIISIPQTPWVKNYMGMKEDNKSGERM